MTYDTMHIPEWWRETTAEEYCFKVADWTHDSPKQSVEWKYLVTSKNLKDWRLDLSSSYKISLADFELVNKRSKVDKWDILVGMIWTVGEVCLIKNEPDFAIKNVWLFKCWDYEKSIFLYYFLRSSRWQEYILSRLSWTTQKYITLWDLRKFPIIHPINPVEQQYIADILSSLDAKIELLREQNETLEQTAQTIFHEWFGRYSVENPEELPEGWRVGKIMEIIKREPVSYKCDKNDLDSKWTIPIIDQWITWLYGYTSRKPDFIASRENPVIVFTNHTCNYWFVDYPFCAIQNVLPYRGKNGYDEYFLYFITKWSIVFIEYKWHWPDFEAKDFIIPPVEKAWEFSKLAKPILEKISYNNSQIQSLSKTRDTLLPKLMNGELRMI